MNPFDSPRLAWQKLRPLILLAAVVALAWFLLESLVFRTGFYYRNLAQPSSNAGTTVMNLRLARRLASISPPTILVFGDSRVGQGFSPDIAHRTEPSLNFINVAVPGSMPRTWYYLLRAMERKGVHFDAIVVGNLYPMMGAAHWADWSLDLNFLVPMVDLRDAMSFPQSFDAPASRERANFAVWLPALAMQKDIQDLLGSPRERRRALRGKRWWLENIRNYRSRDEVMPSLNFSPTREVLDWANATADQRGSVEQHLRVLEQAPADNDAYARIWYGKLLELARRHQAPLILYPLPRGPFAAILPTEDVLPAWLTELANEPDVEVLPADLLKDLEAPDYFFDALHANRLGQEITSERVARAVARRIGKTITAPAQVTEP